MQLDGLALNQNRLKGLDTKSVKGRGTVKHYRVFLDNIFENIPYFRANLLYHSLGALDVVSILVLHKLLHDERLEELQSHLLRKTALVELQLRSYYDYRTSRIVYTLTKEVLSESSLLSLKHVGK